MDYVFVLTTAPAAGLDTVAVLDLRYRVRWQVELAFKRLKSLMHARYVPKYHGASARAWIQAKLLGVLLSGALQRAARVSSPWGFLTMPLRPRNLRLFVEPGIPPVQIGTWRSRRNSVRPERPMCMGSRSAVSTDFCL